jgi:predicted TIM-barrel fold metal-dependent hydrolase
MIDSGFVDTHVHFWDLRHPTLRYDWLTADEDDPDLGDYGAIKSRRYLPEDFIGESRFVGIGGVVHVQAAIGSRDPVLESRWLQALSDRWGVPAKIVAAADLADPEAETVLERQATFPAVCGIRDLRYDGYLTDERWERGYATLERFGLVCCDDPLVEAMPKAAALAQRHPGIVYCVDHAGFPRRRDRDYFRQWAAGMRQIARVENTVVKISGLGQADHRWTVESLRPWVLECIELWGPSRAFFGTNWPVDRLFSSYGDIIGAYAEIIGPFTAAERRALWFETARRVFAFGQT